MKLKEYLYQNRISMTDFSKKIGVSHLTIRNTCKGQSLSFSMARKITEATNYAVGIEDLLPELYFTCVSEYIRKHRMDK